MVSVRGNQTNNKITASSSTSTNNRAEVKPVNINNQVEATNNLAKYYSEISQDWAVGEGLIQNIDYSSKTYALQAKESANEAKESMEITQGYMDNAISNIQTAETNALNNIVMQEESALSTVNQGVEQLNTTITEGLDNINTSVTSVVETIETTKTTILKDIEFVADGEKKEIEDLIDSGKDELKESIGDIKVLTTLEIGDIGIAPLGIDETKGKRRYLNGQLIIQEQYVQFTQKLKKAVELYPSLACTESEWQTIATMTVGGQVGKFVVDDEGGTVRLPKIIMPIQGLTDLSKLGEIVEAGLPSISHTHTRGTMNITGTVRTGAPKTDSDPIQASGAFSVTGSSTNIHAYDSTSANTKTSQTVSLNASNNWTGATSTNSAVPAIYGKSNTVQPEAIRYPYFIQVATGAEETVDVTREIELNNPFFFGYYQYFEIAPNNISWLKSQGQWNSKAIYTDYYDWILTNANNGVENFKLSTDTYDDYAWVVNTADETFRLPMKTKNAPFTVNGTANVSVYGNGKSLGLTDGTLTGGMTANNGYASWSNFQKSAYNTNVGTVVSFSDSNAFSNNNKSIGVTTDASKSGLTGKATISTSENTNVSLYFYVGETTQNANLINAGRIEEVVVGKVNRTGDTMTGALTLQDNLNIKRSNTLDYTDTNHTTVSETAGEIYFRDKNDEVVGFVQSYFNQYNNMVLSTSTRRSIDGTIKTAQTQLYVDVNGNANFTFPMCTTKATTTSSATTGKVAVITQNYVSGTSWYRVWSDGWIEQGGLSAFSNKSTATITFAKKFASTPTINISGTLNEIAEIEVNALTTSNFTWLLNYSRTGTIYYYACGY